MTSPVFLREDRKAGPVPASGVHAELLEEIKQAALALMTLVELERSGTYDGYAQGFWTGSDSLLNMARKIVTLVEQRTGELPR